MNTRGKENGRFGEAAPALRWLVVRMEFLRFLPLAISLLSGVPISQGGEAISREVSMFNFGQPSAPVETVSREFSVFNFGSPSANLEAISREVSVFNLGRPANEIEGISREVSVLNVEGLTNQPPVILSLQQNQVAVLGASASFTVVAGGTPALTYQWYFNGTNVLNGATNATLTLSNLVVGNVGSYSVLISNAFGSLFSASAALMFDCAPPPPGVVALWRGDGDTVNIIGAADGIFQGAPSYIQGRVGPAFHFTGQNCVTVADTPETRMGTNSFTFVFWVKPNALIGTVPAEGIRLLQKTRFPGSFFVIDFLPTGQVQMELQDSNLILAADPSDGVIDVGIWTHVAIVVDRELHQTRYYLNGVFDSLKAHPQNFIGHLDVLNVSMEIGSCGWNSFRGDVDEFVFLKRALTGNEIAAIYAAGSAGVCEPPCSPPPAGLVAWWPGENNAIDQVHGMIGTPTNGTTFADGKVGQAFSFDGIDDFVRVSAASQLNISNAITLAAWVNHAHVGAAIQRYVTLSPEKAQIRYDGVGSPAGYHFAIKVGGVFYQLRPGIVPDVGRFHFVVGTYDGAQQRIYIDGILVSTQAVSGPLDPLDADGVVISAGLGEAMHGLIDEPQIYSRAFSGEEIAALYAAGSAGMCTNSAPMIVTHPLSQMVEAGANVTLSVVAGGLPVPQYQWYFDDHRIGGATAPSLTLLNVEVTRAGSYHVVVSNALGSATSASALLTVVAPPVITTQPQFQTVLSGQTASFSIEATGSLPLGFLWYRNGVFLTNIVLNAHLATLSLPNVQTFDSANFQVIVTNVANLSPGVSSAAATLTVLAPVALTAQPTNVQAAVGGSATFCVSATGSAPIRYQWRHNGANIPGATNACLVIASVTLGDGGAYQVVLENAAGTLVSDPALLIIAAPVAPAPDRFTNRFSLTGASGSIGVTNVGATKEPFEPDHAGKPGGSSVWYRWVAPSSGIATFRTLGSTFDTLLAIYSGTNLSQLTTVASDEDGGGFFTSLVAFNAVQGAEYAIALDGFGGAQGSFILSWSLEVTAQVLPVIVSQPGSRTVTLGASTTLGVGASGSGLRYQWYFLGAALSGQTNSTLNLASVQAVNVGNYFVAVTNSQGRGVHSDVAVVEIGPEPGVQSQDKFGDLFLGGGGGGGAFAPASTGGGFISVSVGTTASQTLNNNGASTQSGEADHCVVISTATRWLRYRAESAGVLRFDTLGSAIPTVVEVYSTLNVLGLPSGSVACGKTNAPDGRSSVVSFGAVAGKEYYVAVDGFRGAVGVIELNARLGAAPALPTANPTNAIVEAGYEFVLAAPLPLTGTNGVSYQWRLDGRNISGATQPTYQLSAADAAAGGVYSVVIYNEYGQVLYTVGTVAVQIDYLRAEPSLVNGRLRLWVQRPATGAVLIEGANALGQWTPLYTVPVTAPGPTVDVPVSPTGPRFFRGKPWP